MPAAPFSIVMTNLDGADWLRGALRSLREGTLQPAEVVITDDGSTDDSREIAEGFGARFLSGGPRTGWSASSNRGMRAASQPWVLLINNDIEFAPDAIEELAAAVTRYPDAAFVSPLILSLRDRERIDSAGLVLYPDGTARPRWHGARASEHTFREEDVLIPSGAAVLLRREWFATIGGFDEGFRSYCEDVDWALRSARLGGRGHFVPAAVIYHHFSGSHGALSPMKARYVERNRLITAVRHLPARMLLASPYWTLRRWLTLSSVVVAAPEGQRTASRFRLGLAAVTGLGQGIFSIPRAVRERRVLSARATLDGPSLAIRLGAFRGTSDDMRRFGQLGK